VDVVGVDHVCIGTDQQVAPGIVQDYSKWVHLIAAMLRGGFSPDEAARSPAATICASSERRSAEATG
jgi:microsomal dipeptidase-like Zn-dependent dipeptidase